MRNSESIKGIAVALSKAQAEIETAEFDSTNPHFHSRYASLTAVMKAVRKPLANHGLAIIQTPEQAEGGKLVLVTMLLHASGEFIAGEVPIILSKNDMQGLGSAITYAKRYGISALLGVVTDEDDDGNQASEPPRREMPKLNLSQISRAGPDMPMSSMNVTHVGTDSSGSAPRLVGKAFGGSTVASVTESVLSHGRLATEPQKKKVWAMLKGELGLSDEDARVFIVRHIGEKKTSQLTSADIDKLILEIKRNLPQAQ